MSRFFKFTLLMDGFFLATWPLYPVFMHSLHIVLEQALIPLQAISTLILEALINGSSFIIRQITALFCADFGTTLAIQTCQEWSVWLSETSKQLRNLLEQFALVVKANNYLPFCLHHLCALAAHLDPLVN